MHGNLQNISNLERNNERPNIVLFGESLDEYKVRQVFTFIAKQHPDDCYIIGTSMRFPYLRNIVEKAKMKGTKIIHVNPDPNYDCHLYKNGPRSFPIKIRTPETLLLSL